MTILRGPHCGSLHFVVGDPQSDVCTTRGCGCTMERLTDDAEISVAVYKVLLGHDHRVGAAVMAEVP